MAYLDFGRRILDKAAAELADMADCEVNAHMEGRNMFSIFTIKKNMVKKLRADRDKLRRTEEMERRSAGGEAPLPEPEEPEDVDDAGSEEGVEAEAQESTEQ